MSSDQNEKQNKDRKPSLWLRCVMTSVIALLGWIPCEVLGGLIFLSMGARLWAYHITPLFWDLTSFVGWAILLPVLGAHCCVYLLWEKRADVKGPKKWLYRSLFLMIMGPINEVIWNTLIWSTVGTPLFLYTVLPTFHGSGSVLSPLYYLTLLLGFYMDEKIPGTVGYRGYEGSSKGEQPTIPKLETGDALSHSASTARLDPTG